MKKKAKESELSELHAEVAKKIRDKITSADCSIKDIELALRFLKDNDIKCDKDYSSTLAEIEAGVDVKTLPFTVGE